MRDAHVPAGGLDQAGIILVRPKYPENIGASARVACNFGITRLTVVSDEERATLWPRLVQVYADYDDYQKRTERTIPVLRVARR